MARNDLNIKVGVEDRFTREFRSIINKAESDTQSLKSEFTQTARKFDTEMKQATQNFQTNMKSATQDIQSDLNNLDISSIKESLSGGIGGITQNLGSLASAGTLAGGAVASGAALAVNETMRAQMEAQNLTQAIGKSNDALRSQLRTISQNWNTTQEELIATSNIFTNEFQKSGEEAFEIINEGFRKGANVRGEFLEQLKEYSSQFRDVGLNAEETVSVITQFQQKGFLTDKAVDAIKEGGIQIREMTKRTREALTSIGINVDRFQSKLQSGAMTQTEALKNVAERVNDLGIESKKAQTAVSDIFRNAGEDVGRRFFKVLENMNAQLDKVPDKMTDAKEASNDLTREWNKLMTGLFGPESVVADAIVWTKEQLAGMIDALNKLFGFEKRESEKQKSPKEKLKETNKSISKYNEIIESGEVPSGGNYVGYSIEDIKGARSNLIDRRAELRNRVQQNKDFRDMANLDLLNKEFSTVNNNAGDGEGDGDGERYGDGETSPVNNETNIRGSSQKALTINIEKQIETVNINDIEDVDALRDKLTQLLNEIILDVNPVV